MPPRSRVVDQCRTKSQKSLDIHVELWATGGFRSLPADARQLATEPFGFDCE
jgi:hypothetical protein